MPGYANCTIWHLKELVGNKRRLIKSNDVKHASLPLFEGLYIDDLLGFAKSHNAGEIMKALPAVDKEIGKLPREYLGNICQTIAGPTFTTCVKARVEARNAKLAEDRQSGIEMDQTIANIFQ